MGFYEYNFIALIIGCGLLKYRQRQQDAQTLAEKQSDGEALDLGGQVEADNFQKSFLIVYMLVMGSDWLQVSAIAQLHRRLWWDPDSELTICLNE